MRILFSWIAFKEDLVKSKKTGIISGPTLQLLFSEKFDVLHLFSSDKETQEKASKLKSYVEEHQETKGEFGKNRNIKIYLEFLPLRSPADYLNLWEKLPEKVKSIILRVNDRGPYIEGRILDCSYGAALKLDFADQGTANVKIEIIEWGDDVYMHHN